MIYQLTNKKQLSYRYYNGLNSPNIENKNKIEIAYVNQRLNGLSISSNYGEHYGVTTTDEKRNVIILAPWRPSLR